MRVLAVVALALMVPALTPSTKAATYNWNGVDNGLWSTPVNWSDTVPVAGAVAVFAESGAGANVDVDAGATAGGITFNGNVANMEIKSTGGSTLALDNGGGTVQVRADAGIHSISAHFDSTAGGVGPGGGVDFSGPGKIILSGTNTIGKPGTDNHHAIGIKPDADVEIAGGSTTTLLPSATDLITAPNGEVDGKLTVSGTGSFTTGGHDYSLRGTITVKDQGKLTFVDGGIFDTGTGVGGVLTVKDQGTLTVDRANIQGGGAGPYSGSWTVGGLILGMGWSVASSIINQDGGTVNLPYFEPWLTGNGWGLCYGPGSWRRGTEVKGTYNLNGGTLNVSAIGAITDTGIALVRPESGNSNSAAIFNFNGGVLKATQDDSTAGGAVSEGSNHLMFNISHAYVRKNVSSGLGAVIDTGSFNCSINQALEHDPALGGDPDGGLRKLGDGALTLLQVNTYTGNTTVEAGTLTLADNAQLKFVIGAASGVNNSITGAGTAVLNGDFYIDTALADDADLASGTWLLENVTSLAGAYGGTFQVVDSNSIPWRVHGDQWTKRLGAEMVYTFVETTGTLTLGVYRPGTMLIVR